jgi:hypothetical protein
MSDAAALGLYEKRYDFGTGFFYYVCRSDGKVHVVEALFGRVGADPRPLIIGQV